MQENLYKYLLMLGDNSMILGHRLSELCGHGPTLETDIALTNISLDLFGQVRNYFQYAAKVKGNESTEDSIAFMRKERDIYNVLLVEQPNEDFAHVVGRQYLFDVYHHFLLEELLGSKDERIAAIATKSLKEVKYHKRFSGEWIKRLGGGTEESNRRIQDAIDHMFPFVDELCKITPIEKEMTDSGIGPDLSALKEIYYPIIKEHILNAGLIVPDIPPRVCKGKEGIHTEQMGYILNDLQFMQKTYPNMEW